MQNAEECKMFIANMDAHSRTLRNLWKMSKLSKSVGSSISLESVMRDIYVFTVDAFKCAQRIVRPFLNAQHEIKIPFIKTAHLAYMMNIGPKQLDKLGTYLQAYNSAMPHGWTSIHKRICDDHIIEKYKLIINTSLHLAAHDFDTGSNQSKINETIVTYRRIHNALPDTLSGKTKIICGLSQIYFINLICAIQDLYNESVHAQTRMCVHSDKHPNFAALQKKMTSLLQLL